MATPSLTPLSPQSPATGAKPTSGAVVININDPVNNAEAHDTNAPSFNTGVAADTFQKASVNPNASPQDQLQQAYLNATGAREAALNSLNEYVNLANQINSTAFAAQQQQPFAPAPGGSPAPAGFRTSSLETPPTDLAQQMQNQQAGQQMQAMQEQLQLQQAALAQQQDETARIQQQYEQQLQQLQQVAAQNQAQVAPQPPAPQQPAMDPALMQPQPQPPADPAMMQGPQQPVGPMDFTQSSNEELNRVLMEGQSLQDKVDAMAEISNRKQGTPETYAILKSIAGEDTSMIPAGEAKDTADYARQTALWTLGMLNGTQNASAPTAQLPGMNVISGILSNPQESPAVKIAALQSLQAMNRPQDPDINKIYNRSKKDPDPGVKARATSAAAGEVIQIPQPQQQAAGLAGLDPSMMQGMDPSVLASMQGQPTPGAPQMQLPGMDPNMLQGIDPALMAQLAGAPQAAAAPGMVPA